MGHAAAGHGDRRRRACSPPSASRAGIDGLLLAPVDRTALFVAKAAALFLYLVVLELVAVPAFGLLLLGPDLSGALPELPLILLLADVGLARSGALVAALAAETRARELIVPLLLLPLLVPLLIAGRRRPPSRCCAATRARTTSGAGWGCSASTMWSSC